MVKRYYCQDHPEILELETTVVNARPGAVLLDASPFFPGGGGQQPDRGILSWSGGNASVIGFEFDGEELWHRLDTDDEPQGTVRFSVDPAFRRHMCRQHTAAHIVNAIVFTAFDGALLTGVQLGETEGFRIDFDLPDVENDRLRAMAGAINEAIAGDLVVSDFHMNWEEAESVPGMFRAKSVSPPKLDDGSVRIVEIAGLDRQACGGTHVATTGEVGRIDMRKVENKGRHNRRLRLALADIG